LDKSLILGPGELGAFMIFLNPFVAIHALQEVCRGRVPILESVR
jgi:hypothetical protein